MLHIPELNVFIPSPLDGDINVYALGGQKPTHEGMWHGVPSRNCVYHTAGIRVHLHPMALDNSFAIITKREYKIGNVYSVGLPLNSKSSSVYVNMILFPLIKIGYYFLPEPNANVSMLYTVLKGDLIGVALLLHFSTEWDAAYIRYCTPMVGGPIQLTHKTMTSSYFFEQTAAIKLLNYNMMLLHHFFYLNQIEKGQIVTHRNNIDGWCVLHAANPVLSMIVLALFHHLCTISC